MDESLHIGDASQLDYSRTCDIMAPAAISRTTATQSSLLLGTNEHDQSVEEEYLRP